MGFLRSSFPCIIGGSNMKRIFVLFLAALLLTGCAATPAEPETTVPTTAETIPVETEPPVIYADQLADGVYEITVDSSSSIFRVVH